MAGHHRICVAAQPAPPCGQHHVSETDGQWLRTGAARGSGDRWRPASGRRSRARVLQNVHPAGTVQRIQVANHKDGLSGVDPRAHASPDRRSRFQAVGPAGLFAMHVHDADPHGAAPILDPYHAARAPGMRPGTINTRCLSPAPCDRVPPRGRPMVRVGNRAHEWATGSV